MTSHQDGKVNREVKRQTFSSRYEKTIQAGFSFDNLTECAQYTFSMALVPLAAKALTEAPPVDKGFKSVNVVMPPARDLLDALDLNVTLVDATSTRASFKVQC